MRNKLLKIELDKENFNLARVHGSKVINYIAKSDDLKINQMDFIIFKNVESGEILRNFFSEPGKDTLECSKEYLIKYSNENTIEHLKENTIEYTTAWNGPFEVNKKHFALTAVITNLYTSIQHIRLNAPTKKQWFVDKFPYDEVRSELSLIKHCVALLEEKMDIQEFQNELETFSQKNYYYESTNALLSEYPWNYKMNDSCRISIEKIKSAVEQIEADIKDKHRLEKVWFLAYQVHNEPGNILESVIIGEKIL